MDSPPNCDEVKCLTREINRAHTVFCARHSIAAFVHNRDGAARHVHAKRPVCVAIQLRAKGQARV